MLKKVLWIAAAAAAVLVALAVSRTLDFTSGEPPKKTPEAPAAEQAAVPAVAKAPEVKTVETPPAAPPPTPEELQVQEDAAATGMTTVEPEEAPPEQPPT